MSRAPLDLLCARAPWTGKGWTLTAGEVQDLYAAIASLDPSPWRYLGVTRGHRKADRAFQLLRRAGLIEFADGTWTAAATPMERG